MKVLSGVYAHGTYEGDIVLDEKVVEFNDIKSSEERGIVIIHQELALSPFLSIAENIFLGNEIKKAGMVDWNDTNAEAAKLLAPVGLSGTPDTRLMVIGLVTKHLLELRTALYVCVTCFLI